MLAGADAVSGTCGLRLRDYGDEIVLSGFPGIRSLPVYNSILDAATPGQSDKPARTTVTAYRDVLDQLWLLDSVPAALLGP